MKPRIRAAASMALASIFLALLAPTAKAEVLTFNPAQLSVANHCTASSVIGMLGRMRSLQKFTNGDPFAVSPTDAVLGAAQSMSPLSLVSTNPAGGSTPIWQYNGGSCAAVANKLSTAIASAQQSGKWISADFRDGYVPSFNLIDPPGAKVQTKVAEESKKRLDATKGFFCKFSKDENLAPRKIDPGCGAGIYLAQVDCQDELGGTMKTRVACNYEIAKFSATACFQQAISAPTAVLTEAQMGSGDQNSSGNATEAK